ncbi:MAG: signal recognition particle-docking protein FtsY [archaeon]
MFKFLKEKLKGFFKKGAEETIEKAAEEREEETIEKKHPIKTELKKKETNITEIPKEKKESEPEMQEEKPKEGFFSRLKKRYSFKISEDMFSKFWAELEIALLEGNVAIEVVEKVKHELHSSLVGIEAEKEKVKELIKTELKKALLGIMAEPFDIISRINSGKKPYVIVLFGINGSGKTTTIAKLAFYLKQRNLSCVLAASDTFRAASIEQIEKHAAKLGVKVIKHSYGADAAAVAFDAVEYAKSHSIDVVLVDTAGRMHNQSNLMREMEKICRVAKPDMKIFIGEATVGNDMIEQAKDFSEKIGIDAIILSKADVDEKGGAAVSASYIAKKPVIFLGTGQEYKDLELFDREKILERIGL